MPGSARQQPHFTDQFRFILGLRYTHDEVNSGFYSTAYAGIDPFPGSGLLPPGANDISHSNTSVHTGLQYDLTDAVMAYATFSTGYKGPTISNIAGEARQILPETSRDYEIGLKSEWFDHRLVLNLAGFYEKYHNFQAQIFDTSVTPSVFTLGQCRRLAVKGVGGRVHWPDRSESDGIGRRDLCSQHLHGIHQPMLCRPADFTRAGTGLLSGFRQPCRIPAVAGAALELHIERDLASHPVMDGYSVDANANWVWKSQVYTVVPDPNTIISSYGLLGVNVGLSPDDGTMASRRLCAQPVRPAFLQLGLPELLRSGRLCARPGGRGAPHDGLYRRLQVGGLMEPANRRIFAASFTAIVATAFCFILRALVIDDWGREFALSETQKGELLGVGLWPFSISDRPAQPADRPDRFPRRCSGSPPSVTWWG